MGDEIVNHMRAFEKYGLYCLLILEVLIFTFLVSFYPSLGALNMFGLIFLYVILYVLFFSRIHSKLILLDLINIIFLTIGLIMVVYLAFLQELLYCYDFCTQKDRFIQPLFNLFFLVQIILLIWSRVKNHKKVT